MNWETFSSESDLDWSDLDDYSTMNAIIEQFSLKVLL